MKFICCVAISIAFLSTLCWAEGVENVNSGRIVNGQLASSTEIRHQVAIQVCANNCTSNSTIASIRCTGALINWGTILTVAQCVRGIPLNTIRLVAGTTFVGTGNITSPGQVRFPSRITIHGSSSANNFNNDIAIIRVATPFTESTSLRRIQWRESGTNSREICVISGFGGATSAGIPDGYLRRANAQIFDHSVCKRTFASVNDNMICANDSLTSPCGGDAGAALICGGRIAGLVSHGAQGCPIGVPAVYTEVYKYTDWIMTNNSMKVRISVLSLMISMLMAYFMH